VIARLCLDFGVIWLVDLNDLNGRWMSEAARLGNCLHKSQLDVPTNLLIGVTGCNIFANFSFTTGIC
jgi:hypothetical protein